MMNVQDQYFDDVHDAVKRARAVLGADFVSSDEIGAIRPDLGYTPQQIAKLTNTIPSKEVLYSLKKNGCVLMPHPPSARNLLAIRKTDPCHFYSSKLRAGCWYDNQEFARDDMTGNGWLMIKKVPVSGSTGKYWSEQTKLLSHAERVPNAAEMSWFITTFFAIRGIRLFADGYVRTSSRDRLGRRILVGSFDKTGLRIHFWWDTHRFGRIGLASALKV